MQTHRSTEATGFHFIPAIIQYKMYPIIFYIIAMYPSCRIRSHLMVEVVELAVPPTFELKFYIFTLLN